jgi:hypothetical protein
MVYLDTIQAISQKQLFMQGCLSHGTLAIQEVVEMEMVVEAIEEVVVEEEMLLLLGHQLQEIVFEAER